MNRTRTVPPKTGPTPPETPRLGSASSAVGMPNQEGAAVRLARDTELAKDGWERRFTGSPPRLADMKELYEMLGQEVLLDDVLPGELAQECEGCTLALALFKVIYTRRSGTVRGGHT